MSRECVDVNGLSIIDDVMKTMTTCNTIVNDTCSFKFYLI